MNTEQSRSVVTEAWKAFRTRDQARISQLFTDDAEWTAPEGNATAVALKGPSHMVGNQAIAMFLSTTLHKLFQKIEIDIRGVFADGETVIVEEHMRAEIPNGNTYNNDYCFVFELKEGKIRRVREYMDTLRGKELILGPALGA
jgi:ketosteroid isomerase-like protein